MRAHRARQSGSGLALVLICIGALLRILGARGELWLDELWTISLIRPFTEPAQVLSLHSDNNHLLNSLWIFLVGCDSSAVLIRLLSLLASVGLLMVLWRAWRAGAATTFALSLITTSYTLVLYGSEARGYSVMLLSLFSVWWIVDAAISSERALGFLDAIVILFFSTLGAFAHASFLYWYPAVILWVMVNRENRVANTWALIPGGAAQGALYWFFFRFITPGTGPLKSNIQVIIDAVSSVGGGPELSVYSDFGNGWALGAAALVTLLALFEFCVLFFKGDQRWAFYLFAIVVGPALSIYLHEPRVIFIRYFLPSIITLYLLLGAALARIAARDVVGKVLAFLFFAAIAYGAMQQNVRLVQFHRGNTHALISYLVSKTPDGEIVVKGDHPFRDRMMLERFTAGVSGGERLVYTESNTAPWQLISNQSPYFVPPKEVREEGLFLVAEFRSATLSGWNWYLYRKQGPL